MRILRPVSVTLMGLACVVGLQAAWLPLKAEIAQNLLEREWNRTLAGELRARPWPWADTAPVGVLEAPAQSQRLLILEGASGRNLAFAPAALGPLDQPDVLISGHRDTHFAFLADLTLGDPLIVRSPGGVRTYHVEHVEVVDSRLARMPVETGIDRLTLVTCYPFDTIAPGGPLRWVVTAIPVTAQPEEPFPRPIPAMRKKSPPSGGPFKTSR